MTQRYHPGTRREGQHVIEYLWSVVDQLQDWPIGVYPTPREHDRGTAGFPDGAGLYRKTGDPMPRFPIGGVMFVGHNTDAKDKHASRRTHGLSPGEPPKGRMSTWVRLYAVMERAGFDRKEMFFTNIYVGLMAGSNPRASFLGARDPSFRAWCDEFLDEQIQLMRPRAIVTLGRKAREALGWEHGFIGMHERAGVKFNGAALMHPSSPDLYKPRLGTSELIIDHEARVLKEVSTL